MTSLIKKKIDKKIYWYIVENNTIEGKNKRTYLKSLGTIKASDAKMKLGRFEGSQQGRIALHFALIQFNACFVTQIGRKIKPNTFRIRCWCANKIETFLGRYLLC